METVKIKIMKNIVNTILLIVLFALLLFLLYNGLEIIRLL